MTERGLEVRRVLGRIVLAAAVLATLWAVRNATREGRLLLFVPWFAGLVGLLQVREKT